jgi:cyclophilin family peptidyl-prolyl cis-trans isomerase
MNLFPQHAPKAVENFVGHARSGYFEGVIFHRVMPKFMIQTGDPLGDGMGGCRSGAGNLKMRSAFSSSFFLSYRLNSSCATINELSYLILTAFVTDHTCHMRVASQEGALLVRSFQIQPSSENVHNANQPD